MLSTLREEILPNLETTIGQRALDQNADKFLFVVVSRQTKKVILRVLCGSTLLITLSPSKGASAVKKSESALICENLRLSS